MGVGGQAVIHPPGPLRRGLRAVGRGRERSHGDFAGGCRRCDGTLRGVAWAARGRARRRAMEAAAGDGKGVTGRRVVVGVRCACVWRFLRWDGAQALPRKAHPRPGPVRLPWSLLPAATRQHEAPKDTTSVLVGDDFGMCSCAGVTGAAVPVQQPIAKPVSGFHVPMRAWLLSPDDDKGQGSCGRLTQLLPCYSQHRVSRDRDAPLTRPAGSAGDDAGARLLRDSHAASSTPCAARGP